MLSPFSDVIAAEIPVMSELIIQTVSLEYLVKFSSDRRKDAVVQHLAYRSFKTHAENVFRINVFKMSLRLVCHLD